MKTAWLVFGITVLILALPASLGLVAVAQVQGLHEEEAGTSGYQFVAAVLELQPESTSLVRDAMKDDRISKAEYLEIHALDDKLTKERAKTKIRSILSERSK